LGELGLEEIYTKLLWDGYGLKCVGGSRIRTGFLCKTEQGWREVRRYPAKIENIEFEYGLRQHLLKNGFQGLPHVCLTKEEKPFFLLENVPYVVEIPAAGQPMEESEENFVKGAELLAQLHNAGKGFQTPFPKNSIGKLADVCQKRSAEFMRIQKRIHRQSGYNPLDLIIKQQYHTVQIQLKKASDVFQSTLYRTACSDAAQNHEICHNSFKGEHVLCDEQNHLYVTGWEHASFDVPLLDLAAYIRRFVKKTQADPRVGEKILKAYDKQKRLKKQDCLLLKGFLTYPEKFLRLCNEYYNKRRVCVSPAVRERMENCILADQKLKAFLECFPEDSDFL